MKRLTSFAIFIFILIGEFQLHAQIFQWARKIGNSPGELGRSIKVDAAGNVYTIGRFLQTVDFNPGAGVYNMTALGSLDVFLTKFNSSGNFVWAKQFGGAPGSTSAEDLSLDAAGNIYITGQFHNTVDFDPNAGVANLTANGASSDIFIVKLSSAGNYVWARRIGGTMTDSGEGICTDASSNVYITGIFRSTCDFNPGTGVVNLTSASQDAFILKLNSAGNYVWSQAISATSASLAYGEDIAVDNSGNVYLTGSFIGTCDFNPGAGTINRTSVGGYDAFVLKLNSTPVYQWVSICGGTTSDFSEALSIDPSGNIIFGGDFSGTCDFNPAAAVQNITSAGGKDAYLVKLTSAGNLSWVRTFGSSQTDEVSGIDIDATGSIYFTGIFSQSVDFNPGAGTSFLTSLGSTDIFVCKLNSAGNYNWSVRTGGTVQDYGYGVSVLSSNYVHVTGAFMATSDFNPGSGVSNLTSAGLTDVFVLKLGQFDPLPIDLISFEAIGNKNSVDLFWQTASETNNDYFNIERSSDADRWEDIKAIDGAGNSTEYLSYNTVDDQPYNGISYYRLKQTDYDGKFSYSDVRAIRLDIKKKIVLYPNPANSELFIIKDSDKYFKIYDLTGRDLTSRTQIISSNNEVTIIDISALANDLYIFRCGDSAEKFRKYH